MRRIRDIDALRDESGQAMVFAVVVMIVGALFAAAIVAGSQQSSATTTARKQRTNTLPHLDSAVQKYVTALKAGVVSEANQYVMDAAIAGQVAGPGNTVAGVGGNVPAIAGAQPWAMREARGAAGTEAAYWQILAVVPPLHQDLAVDSQLLTVYFRAWTEQGTCNGAPCAGDPRYFRAQFRPGYFSDYQLVSDDAIRVFPGMSINGRVHTNGFLDGINDPPGGTGDLRRVWQDGGAATCAAGSLVSSARGTVDVGAVPGCQVENNMGRFMSMTKGEDALARIRPHCGGAAACL